MATNIAEFISVLRRIRDEIHPDIEATYASALVLKQAIDSGTISLNEDLAQFAVDYQNFLTKYNTIDTKVTSATNSANSAEASALLASQKASEIQGITAVATTIAEGFPANVSYNSASGEFTFGIPVGNTGQRGEKGDSFTVNSSGLTAEKTLYDNRLKGWSFLDLTLKLLYFKLSDTNADWSTGFPFGKGDTGNGIEEIVFVSTTDASGLPAKSGATDTYRINYTDTTFDTFNVYNGLDLDIVVDANGNIGSGTQSFNGFGGSGFKNKIINGNFDVWQRGISQTADGYGSADRWFTQFDGNCTLAYEQAAYNNTAKLSWTSAGTYKNFLTSIEDGARKLQGKTVTMSFMAKAATAGTCSTYVGRGIGAGNSAGIDSISINLTTSWQKITRTFTMPIYDNANMTLVVGLISMQLLGASNTVWIKEVQFEEGSIATPFENRPYGLELSLCQRYFVLIRQRVIESRAVGEYASVTTTLPNRMRTVAPTVTLVTTNSSVNVGTNTVSAATDINLSRQIVAAATGIIDSDLTYSLATEL